MLVSLFADASYHDKDKAGGWGAWVRSERGRAYNGGAWGGIVQSSTLAEFLAVIEGIEMATRTGIAQIGDHILIQSDCKGIEKWFRGGSIFIGHDDMHKYFQVNGSYTFEGWFLDAIMDHIRKYEYTIALRHVKGHQANDTTRNYVNNLCDRLAKQGGRNAKVCRHIKDPDKWFATFKKLLHPDKVDMQQVLPGDIEREKREQGQVIENNGKVIINFG